MSTSRLMATALLVVSCGVVKPVLSPRDVGVIMISQPSNTTIDSGETVYPLCLAYVWDSVPQPVRYRVRMTIGTDYDTTMQVTEEAGRTCEAVAFPSWRATERGRLMVCCSTELSGDVQQGNDKMTGAVYVQVRDVGCCTIVAPSGTVTNPVFPACLVSNFGTNLADYRVHMKFDGALPDGVYEEVVLVNNHVPGTSRYVGFPLPGPVLGSHSVSCWTELADDMVPANDTATGSFSCQSPRIGDSR